MMTSHLQRHLVMFSRSYEVKDVVVAVMLDRSSGLDEGHVANKLQQMLNVQPTSVNSIMIQYSIPEGKTF